MDLFWFLLLIILILLCFGFAIFKLKLTPGQQEEVKQDYGRKCETVCTCITAIIIGYLIVTFWTIFKIIFIIVLAILAIDTLRQMA